MAPFILELILFGSQFVDLILHPDDLFTNLTTLRDPCRMLCDAVGFDSQVISDFICGGHAGFIGFIERPCPCERFDLRMLSAALEPRCTHELPAGLPVVA